MWEENLYLSKKLKNKFVKGYNFPIHVYEEPYFSYLLRLYNEDFGTLEKWKEFYTQFLDHFNSEEHFFQKYNNLKDLAIDKIVNSDGYEKFQNLDMNDWKVDSKEFNNRPKNIYLQNNHNELFWSIDFKKANFYTLKYFDIIKEDTYLQFINNIEPPESDLDSLLPKIKFFEESKQLRQVIFGHANPKRQQKIQSYFLFQLYKDLKKSLGDEIEEIYVLGSDEIIFKPNKPDGNKVQVNQFIEQEQDKIPYPLSVNPFLVKQLSSARNVYVKEYGDRFELKNVPNYFYPQYYKYYLNYEIDHNLDLVFFHDGKLAEFVNINEDIRRNYE